MQNSRTKNILYHFVYGRYKIVVGNTVIFNTYGPDKNQLSSQAEMMNIEVCQV